MYVKNYDLIINLGVLPAIFATIDKYDNFSVFGGHHCSLALDMA